MPLYLVRSPLVPMILHFLRDDQDMYLNHNAVFDLDRDETRLPRLVEVTYLKNVENGGHSARECLEIADVDPSIYRFVHDQRFEHTLQLSELVFNLGSPLGSFQKDRTEAMSGTYFRLFPNLKDSPCCGLERRVCVRGAVHDGQQVIALVAGTIASWSSVAPDVLRL